MRDKVVEATVKLLQHEDAMPTQRDLLYLTAVGAVGISDHVKAILSHLKHAGKAEKIVLLHGMGGIGKSTLARAVFDELVDSINTYARNCFVVLHERMSKDKDITRVQAELLHKLAHVTSQHGTGLYSSREGRSKLAEKLTGKSVLLVVDNVWANQLTDLLPRNFMQLLGKDSMVLITSRKKEAAGEHQQVVEVPMSFLGDEQASYLFCKHAFPQHQTVDTSWKVHIASTIWAEQIQGVLRKCNGLPLAIEVAGKYFRTASDANKAAFESNFVDACEHQLADAVWESSRTLFGALKLSWNALVEKDRDALLDIAFHLTGEPWASVDGHFQGKVLDRLRDSSLIMQDSGRDPATVVLHDMVSFFCNNICPSPERAKFTTRIGQKQVCGLCWAASFAGLA
jgi:ABC-type molybdenum transport system ATPase subunit/photorepair protein PhrA